MEETRNLTTFGGITSFAPSAGNGTVGTPRVVNLERALRAGQELGGHLVSGHVHGMGAILSSSTAPDGSRNVWIGLPHSVPSAPNLSYKGSVTIDGVSLTVAEVVPHPKISTPAFHSSSKALQALGIARLDNMVAFRVSLIPATLSATTLDATTNIPGHLVNIEVDGSSSPHASASSWLPSPTTTTSSSPTPLPTPAPAPAPVPETQEERDVYFMTRAVAVGETARKTAPPNPWVGCVIVAADGVTVLGEGVHRAAGLAHAERDAIEGIRRRGEGEKLVGSTVYTTLEPCHTQGRTPPCDALLVACRVGRVVVGVVDPDALTDGRGVDTLTAAGIEVTTGVAEELVRSSLAPYLHHRAMAAPYVVLKTALSVDGCIAAADGSSQWITNAQARKCGHHLRSRSGAVLFGSGTVLADNPRGTFRNLPAPSADVLALNPLAALGTRQPLRVVLDTRGRVLRAGLDALSKGQDPPAVFNGALGRTLICVGETGLEIVDEAEDAGLVGSSHDAVSVLHLPVSRETGSIDLRLLLAHLGMNESILQVMVEGGGILHAAFLNAGLANEVHIYRGNKVLGGVPWLGLGALGRVGSIGDAPGLGLAETARVGGDNVFERWVSDPRLVSADPPLVSSLVRTSPEVVSFTPIPEVIKAFGRGEIVVVMDDEDRENEGDLVVAGELAKEEDVVFFLEHTTGILCTPMSASRASDLGLPLMVPPASSSDPHGTAFTITVDAVDATTGASAAERAWTSRLVATGDKGDLRRPGHVFPLIARSGGLGVRVGHTEAGVTLAKLAGLAPVALLSEIVDKSDPKGGMGRQDVCARIARENGLAFTTVARIKAYMEEEGIPFELDEDVEVDPNSGAFAACFLDRSSRPGTPWVLRVYRNGTRVLVFGVEGSDPNGRLEPGKGPVLTRIHSDCFTGDVLDSAHCDCGPQLRAALSAIEEEGRGVVILPAGHEGRGIGLFDKVKAYRAMREIPDLDTYAANLLVGHEEDARSYGDCRYLLEDVGVGGVVLLTSNPDKIAALGEMVVESRPLISGVSVRNAGYLKAKAERHGDSELARSVQEITAEDDVGAAQPGGVGIGGYQKSLLSAVSMPALSRERVEEAKPLILIVRAAWHAPVIQAVVDEMARFMSEDYGVDVEAQIEQVVVPGSFELLYGIEKVVTRMEEEGRKPDVVIALGILIKGETAHFEYVSTAVVTALPSLQSRLGVPIVNGVLNVYGVEQAIARCDPESEHCCAHSLGMTGLRMALLS